MRHAAGLACTALLLTPTVDVTVSVPAATAATPVNEGRLAPGVLGDQQLRVGFGTALSVAAGHQYHGVAYVNATIEGEEHGCLGCQAVLFKDYLENHHPALVRVEQHVLEMPTFQAQRDVFWNMFQQRRLILGGVGGLTDMDFTDSLVDLARMTPRLYSKADVSESQYDIAQPVANVELHGPKALALFRTVWPDIDELAYSANNSRTTRERVSEVLKRVKQHFTFYRAACLAENCTDPPKPTIMLGTMACSVEDQQHGDCVFAEARKCQNQCGNKWAEFGRFHGIEALFEVRRGRCSEFSRIGYAMLLALGYDSRMVIDFTDHVWVEVRLPHGPKGSWYHGDPSEGIFDRPYMYEKGWGKKLTYVFGVTPRSVEDISERYTENYQEMQQRRGVTEKMLLTSVLEANRRIHMEVPKAHWGFADGGSTLEDVALLSSFN